MNLSSKKETKWPNMSVTILCLAPVHAGISSGFHLRFLVKVTKVFSDGH